MYKIFMTCYFAVTIHMAKSVWITQHSPSVIFANINFFVLSNILQYDSKILRDGTKFSNNIKNDGGVKPFIFNRATER